MACKVGSMEVVEFLVESGANINIRRGDGISPIYLAVIGTYYFSFFFLLFFTFSLALFSLFH